ncbi:transport protein particle subunit [Trichophyton mentagrophytes]|nr:transport protein particle subunit [Trichophyton mentagrophytes]
MTTPEDAPPIKPPPSFSPASPLPTKSRYAERLQNTQQSALTSLSESALPNSLASELQSAPSSRASSPDRRLSRSSQRLSRSSTLSPARHQIDAADDIRSTIIRAFSPTISVYASQETNELVRRKGLKGGFCELLRPFGEKITGKVIIRDGVGSSRSWDDYGVRFVHSNGSRQPSAAGAEDIDKIPPLTQIEKVLETHLEPSSRAASDAIFAGQPTPKGVTLSSPLYRLFLRRLLSADAPTPHETFLHPVACVIAISSSTPSPLEALRQLYASTSHGEQGPQPWIHPEYLRYYVLVHDEDRDDITQSTALFDQMKRHFGLHCHMLRLRSNQCVVTDDDGMPFPTCEWQSSREELIEAKEQEPLLDVGWESPHIFESDVTAIISFIRELVAQSVIPHMENRVAMWNEQVASRRRGLSGRFMSISKRWTGFGSSSKSSGAFGGGGSGSNYDPYQGYYKPDSPEALLRKMADYSFMLRDFKLASSTYDLLRSDFGNDKAWRYHAGAHEMCAISMLLNPLTSTNKSRVDTVDQLLDIACYSYLARCSDGQNTLRTIILGAELLKSRGGSAAENAAKWNMKVLNMNLVGPIGRILVSERTSACFAAKVATEGTKWGTRRRKAAIGKPAFASSCLEEAERYYGPILEEGLFAFPDLRTYVEELRLSVKMGCLEAQGLEGEEEEISEEQLDATEEMNETPSLRRHRRSILGSVGPLENTQSAKILRREDEEPEDDEFE